LKLDAQKIINKYRVVKICGYHNIKNNKMGEIFNPKPNPPPRLPPPKKNCLTHVGHKNNIKCPLRKDFHPRIYFLFIEKLTWNLVNFMREL
jgi:hypothetical protein